MMQKARNIVSIILATALLAGTVNAVAVNSHQSFLDVPSTHWAYGSIQTMADMGIVDGVGRSKFDPNGKVSPTQFANMIVQAFDASDNAIHVNNKCISAMNAAITRAEAARVLSYLMNQQDVPAPSTTELNETRAKIADYNKIAPNSQNAVATVCCHGIMRGVDAKGSFNPDGQLTRAEACVVLERLMHLLEESKPAEIAPSSQVELKDTDVPKDKSPIEDVYLSNGAPIAEENIKAILERVREKYPEGMAWGWSDTYDSPSNPEGMNNNACAGFAWMISDEIFGTNPLVNPYVEHKRFDELKVGDVLLIINNKRAPALCLRGCCPCN